MGTQMKGLGALACAGVLALLGAGEGWAADAPPAAARPGAWSDAIQDRPPEDEITYFLLIDRFENGDRRNDRGLYRGGPLDHGFDPANSGFYHGGDIKGLTARLDYIKALGASAVWVAPVFKNKPVQGDPAVASAGYHGYWITDFLAVDPHFGTRAEFAAFVKAAHAKGLKVYLDIILNHTADVIAYRECHGPGADGSAKSCPYRSVADYPWTRKGGVDGEPINPGFLGDGPDHLTPENFSRVSRADWAYEPFIPAGEEAVKNPAWLNDVRRYHNRGDTRFEGENSLYGDFGGLDDLNTQDPVVVQGMIDIYKSWITDFRVDGFRVDTVKHARPELWQAFVPAILAHAKSLGIQHFHIFGEVYAFEPSALAKFTVEDGLPNVLDFAFQSAVSDYLVHGKSARRFQALFEADVIYAGGAAAARRMPTFLGNHDMGRFAGFLRKAHPEMPDAEMVARTRLAHAVMMFARGVPIIYYGDEQGFVSDGNDRAARETFFPSRTGSYLDNDLIGTDKTHAEPQFDQAHPLFVAIQEMAAIRRNHPTLRRGTMRMRHSDESGGVWAFSRVDSATKEEYLVVFNAEKAPRALNLVVDGRSMAWEAVHGACRARANAPGSYAVTVPAMDFIVCRSGGEGG